MGSGEVIELLPLGEVHFEIDIIGVVEGLIELSLV